MITQLFCELPFQPFLGVKHRLVVPHGRCDFWKKTVVGFLLLLPTVSLRLLRASTVSLSSRSPELRSLLQTLEEHGVSQWRPNPGCPER